MSKDKKSLPAKTGGAQRPSRLNKMIKKLDKISALSDTKGLPFNIRVIARNAPTEISGIIISLENALTIQGTRHGSSKEEVTSIPLNKIISIVGGVNQPSIVTYRGDAVLMQTKRGTLTPKVVGGQSVYHIMDKVTGDEIIVFNHDDITVEAKGDPNEIREASAKKKKPGFKKAK